MRDKKKLSTQDIQALMVMCDSRLAKGYQHGKVIALNTWQLCQEVIELRKENVRLHAELDGIDEYLRYAADMGGVDENEDY